MDSMNLREAAARTYRSVTTLRRYIRAGRLHAEKRDGRYGPEYFVSTENLSAAGLTVDPLETSDADVLTVPAPRSPRSAPPAARDESSVPVLLYQELQWKHEQLLVQYGMMRAGGLRAMQQQAELEDRDRRLEEAGKEIARLRKKLAEDSARLASRLREAEFELEGRGLEVSALQEKVRALELLTRNAVTTEGLDRQYDRLMDQARKVAGPRRRWVLGRTDPD